MSHALEESSAGTVHPRVVILTGLSGSGKSTAIRALEDIGFFCIDNLPVPLLPKVLELAGGGAGASSQAFKRLAFVVDTRDHLHLDQAVGMIEQLRGEGAEVQITFLEASDDVLMRRFSETRRRHPMSQSGTVREGIARERDHLRELRLRADLILDTSQQTVHTLKHLIQDHFATSEEPPLQVTILSFGFKHGLPPECDLVFDLRFLPNPYFVEELRPQTGLDAPVQDFVLSQSEALEFLARFFPLMELLLPLYAREGKSYLTVGVGCTGGRHRSVSIAGRISEHLEGRGWRVNVRHRDVPPS